MTSAKTADSSCPGEPGVGQRMPCGFSRHEPSVIRSRYRDDPRKAKLQEPFRPLCTLYSKFQTRNKNKVGGRAVEIIQFSPSMQPSAMDLSGLLHTTLAQPRPFPRPPSPFSSAVLEGVGGQFLASSCWAGTVAPEQLLMFLGSGIGCQISTMGEVANVARNTGNQWVIP